MIEVLQYRSEQAAGREKPPEPAPRKSSHADSSFRASAFHITFTLNMSQVPFASTSTSSFQSVFNAALKAYEKKTKKDLLAHPLAAQLQACKSPGDILAVLQEKVNEFDRSRIADEGLSRWLDPTINVLYSFSATLGAGVGLVCSIQSTCID